MWYWMESYVFVMNCTWSGRFRCRYQRTYGTWNREVRRSWTSSFRWVVALRRNVEFLLAISVVARLSAMEEWTIEKMASVVVSCKAGTETKQSEMGCIDTGIIRVPETCEYTAEQLPARVWGRWQQWSSWERYFWKPMYEERYDARSTANRTRKRSKHAAVWRLRLTEIQLVSNVDNAAVEV